MPQHSVRRSNRFWRPGEAPGVAGASVLAIISRWWWHPAPVNSGKIPSKANLRVRPAGTLRLYQGCQKMKNRHRPAPFLRGPSEVFRIVDINHETLPGID